MALGDPKSSATEHSVQGEDPTERVVVSIVVERNEHVLQCTHAFVAAYCRQRFLATAAESLTMAAYELLQNGLKHGSVFCDVLLEISESAHAPAVRVSNDAFEARLEKLRAHVARLAVHPEVVFLEEMARSINGGTPRPMLGLARVVHEGRLKLEVHALKNRVTVVARAKG